LVAGVDDAAEVALCVANPWACGAAAAAILCATNPACKKAVQGCFDSVDRMFNETDESSDNSKQDKKLSKGEIDKLIEGGVHPHDLKENARQDLFKDRDGNIIVKPKNGSGPGDPTGYNINYF
jgi:hypothetical protein